MNNLVLVTQKEYVAPHDPSGYVKNVILEDKLVVDALKSLGATVTRTHWDNDEIVWEDYDAVIIRATWDYFHRFDEFWPWIQRVKKLTKLINSPELLEWNIHKFYLQELSKQGVNIPATVFIKKGDKRSLLEVINSTDWKRLVLKPAVSGAARHTYLLSRAPSSEISSVYTDLILQEDMLLQKFQPSIQSKGEASLMLYRGQFSHAILKRTKEGDFRVQDDFGGSVHPYHPNSHEIHFAEHTIAQCSECPVYARVDIFWDENDEIILGELELIEPEMWFRFDENAADKFAHAVIEKL